MTEDEWIEIEEYLKEDLGRKPTNDEIADYYLDRCDGIFDQMKDRELLRQ